MRTSGQVLLIDDDPLVLGVLRYVLTHDDFVVLDALNGSAALQLLKRYTPDLILLDLHMPIMSGPAFLPAYAQVAGRHAPVVVMSGRTTAFNGPGVVGFLPKPIQRHALLKCVRDHVLACAPG